MSLLNHKRPYCTRCLRPQRTCICRWITPIAHAAEVLILQHPSETDQAKGSARLLHLSLPRSRLVIGEVFAEQELQALLYGQSAMVPLLLYPDTDGGKADHTASPPALDERLLCDPAQLRLVVLDGTWRKSRKMLYLNPLLQALPRLPLTDMAPSQYRIRKAHRPDQLSTLEATCYALMQLEQDAEKYLPLLDAFNGFVAQQSGYQAGVVGDGRPASGRE